MDYRLLVDTAVLAGEIMLKNGGEAYRVEDTMKRMIGMSKFKHIETLVLATGIMVTLSDPSIDAITVIRRVSERSTDLNRVYLVNDVSRRFCTSKIDLETAFHELKRIQKQEQYKQSFQDICTVGITTFYTALLGGNLQDCLIAFLCGILLAAAIHYGKYIRVSKFVVDLIGSAVIAACATSFRLYIPELNSDYIIIASIMPLVPGVAITNAIRDTLQGDYVSGSARALEAFLKALFIALGVAAGIGVCVQLFEGVSL